MKPDVTTLREAVGTTQGKFATFLEITQPMLNMIEKSKRLLPTPTLELVMHLRDQYPAANISALPADHALESERTELAKYVRKRKDDLTAEIIIAEIKLFDMEREHHRIMKVHHFLAFVQPVGNATQAKWQRSWYNIFRGDNLDKLKECSLTTLVQLRAKIAGLKAEREVLIAGAV